MFREKAKSQDEIIKQDDFQYSILDSKIEDKKTYIDDISNRGKDLADSKKVEIAKADADIDNYNFKILDIRKEIATLQKEILDETKVNNMKSKLHSMEAKLENTCNKHKKDLKFFETYDDCPTCQQAIDAAFKATMIDKKKEKVTELDSALGQIDKEIKTNQMRLDTINKTMVVIREKELLINRYETSIDQIEIQKRKLENEVAKLQDENISTAEQKGELNELQEQLIQTDIKKKADKEHKIYIDTARALMQDTGIKTKIIKQYLPIMNQYINKYLADMDFFVNFTLDEEFNETIKSRYRDEFNYHSFSEGEKLRIDLAILFTWREIAKLKNSTNTNLLILDEIFDSSLDSSGTDEFMRILHTTMNKENVFVISHKGDTLLDKFPRVMKFEKYKNFTRMVE